MSTITPVATQLERIEQLIAKSHTTTAFLEVSRLEELIRLGEESGAITIDGYPADYARIALNVQKDHYRALCDKAGIVPHQV